MRVNPIVCFNDVHSALQRYHHPAALEQHRAQHWAAVTEHSLRGTGPADALHRLLDQALSTLETQDAPASQLLRLHYVGRTPKAIPAADSVIDRRPLDPRTQHAIQHLATIITRLNQASLRRREAQRFAQQRPVIGLDHLALHLHSRIRDSRASRLAVITGKDGLGKSTLGRLVATRCASDPLFAGVLWANARQIDCGPWAGQSRRRPTTPLNPDDLLLELARELAINMPTDIATLRDEVRAHCALSHYLIVFDNLESSADLAALLPLTELLGDTSRVLVAVRDDAAAQLPAAAPCTHLRLEELDAATSYQLLRSAATWTNAPQLAQASDDELAQVYATVGGNPLALWLVAGQARHMCRADLLRQLQEQRGLGRTEQLYDQLYRAIWADLSDPARAVLFAMHRCETGVEHVLLHELSMLDHPTFTAAIQELQERALLSFDGHYTIHRLTYIFLRVVIAGWYDC